MWGRLLLFFFFSYGDFQFTDAAVLRCYNGSLNNYMTATLDQPEILITSGCINTTKRTVLYVFGFKTTPESPDTELILQTYIDEGVDNVVLLDWSKEAYGPNLTIADDAAFYTVVAVPNSVEVGKQLGYTLITLSNNSLDLSNVLLVGMSLGCPLLGQAGRVVIDKGQELYQIICLDPAGPYYGQPAPVLEPLTKDCAKSVCCLHTDPGFFGLNASYCTSDIYFNFRNYVNGTDLQPGCPSRLVYRGCSHVVVVNYFVDAKDHPGTLLASGASDFWAWAAANGTGTDDIDVGNEQTLRYAQGNYYATTNPSEPYGKGTQGLTG